MYTVSHGNNLHAVQPLQHAVQYLQQAAQQDPPDEACLNQLGQSQHEVSVLLQPGSLMLQHLLEQLPQSCSAQVRVPG